MRCAWKKKLTQGETWDLNMHLASPVPREGASEQASERESARAHTHKGGRESERMPAARATPASTPEIERTRARERERKREREREREKRNACCACEACINSLEIPSRFLAASRY
jgi:hypothetical protein